MRYFVKLAYNGKPFHGWQSQPNAVSVQSVLEEALSVVLRQPLAVVGAGRTDAGVNARIMYAHFNIDSPISAPIDKIIVGLNRLVGHDIAIYDIFPVDDNLHARFDAKEREYKYFVTFQKNVFLYPLSWHCQHPLDVDAMNRAAAILLDTDDFTSFAKLHSDAKTNICDVRHAQWAEWQNDYGTPGIVFTIAADRFLRNMVRAVVGTLVDVGRGKLSVDGFADIINRKDRCAAGTSMPPQALYLWNIKY